MNSEENKMQYLINAQDGYLYIIHKQSVLVDDNCEEIKIGSEVTFLWPEDASRPRKYRGKILHLSTSELALTIFMKEVVKKREKKGKSPVLRIAEDQSNKRLKVASSNDEDLLKKPNEKSRSDKVSIQQRKKLANTLAAKEILKELNTTRMAQSLSESVPNSISNPHQLEVLTEKVDTAISTAKRLVESLYSIKDVLKTSSVAEIAPSPYSLNKDSLAVQECKTVLNTSQSTEYFHQTKYSFSHELSSPNDPKSPLSIITEDSRPSSPTFAFKDEVICHSPPKKSEDFKPGPSSQSKREENVPIQNKLPTSLVAYVNDSSDESCSGDLLEDQDRNKKSYDREIAQPRKLCRNNIVSDNKTLTHHEVDCDSEQNTPQVVDNGAENDMWTLKHSDSHERGKLRELLKGTQIYVRKTVFAMTVEASRTQTGLARMLLEEVFDRKALIKCSLSGGSANGNEKIPVTQKRPGLHKGGVDTILRFVRKHAETHARPFMDDRVVKSSLRSKLTELRKQNALNDAKLQ